jgi:hypothetical protein
MQPKKRNQEMTDDMKLHNRIMDGWTKLEAENTTADDRRKYFMENMDILQPDLHTLVRQGRISRAQAWQDHLKRCEETKRRYKKGRGKVIAIASHHEANKVGCSELRALRKALKIKPSEASRRLEITQKELWAVETCLIEVTQEIKNKVEKYCQELRDRI